jgi:phosphate transport system ATP-binding protein
LNVSTAQIAAPFVTQAPVVMDCKLDKIFYGNFMAVRDSHVPIEKNKITGFIGPSGCGKSTVLRSLNRMNDLVKASALKATCTSSGRTFMARA